MAFGYVAFDPDDHETVLFEGKGRCGEGTSNIAEYRALISGLVACRQHGVEVVHVFGDSQLIINQVLRIWRVQKQDLIDHRNRVWELLAQFREWTMKWVPRRQNQQADALVNQVFERVFVGKGKQCKGGSSKRRAG